MAKERRKSAVIKVTSEDVDCPIAPAAHATVYARTLHIACVILGGIAQLANHLKVDKGSLEGWITGEADPPMPVFLAAVEVVLLHLGHTGQAT